MPPDSNTLVVQDHKQGNFGDYIASTLSLKMKNVPESAMIDKRSCISFDEFTLCTAAHSSPVADWKENVNRGGMINFHTDNTDTDINPSVGMTDHLTVEGSRGKVRILQNIIL